MFTAILKSIRIHANSSGQFDLHPIATTHTNHPYPQHQVPVSNILPIPHTLQSTTKPPPPTPTLTTFTVDNHDKQIICDPIFEQRHVYIVLLAMSE